MRILLVTDSYPPEIRSASHLMYELANELNSRGHKVVVVTSWPAYNLSAGQQTENFSESMVEEGVKVVRCRSLPHHNVNFLIRGIAQLTLPRIYRQTLLRHHTDDFDVTLVYSPPLTLASIGITMKRRAGVPFILNIQDVFPQNAIDLGVLRNPLLIAMFRWMERRAYRQANKILVHSEGNRKFLEARFPDRAKKLNVLHNWTDLERFETPTKAIDFRQTLGLDDRLVFMFAGVMGPSQKLEILVDAARRHVTSLPEILFLLVGDGIERKTLESRAQGLSNVRFLD
ncbi:MAG: glycosyltransferase family 4 protein, partial [Rhodospirillales bacterium]